MTPDIGINAWLDRPVKHITWDKLVKFGAPFYFCFLFCYCCYHVTNSTTENGTIVWFPLRYWTIIAHLQRPEKEHRTNTGQHLWTKSVCGLLSIKIQEKKLSPSPRDSGNYKRTERWRSANHMASEKPVKFGSTNVEKLYFLSENVLGLMFFFYFLYGENFP